MNYEYIEKLVLKAKNDETLSKEELAKEFRPLIINISNKTFLHGYDKHDLQNECYRTLFRCVCLYNVENHRFVAYATNAIKNNMSDLIKRVTNRSSAEGNEALCLSDNLEHSLPSNEDSLENVLCTECDYEDLRFAINKLTDAEKELIKFVFFKNNTVRAYANKKNMCYSTVSQRKKVALTKLNKYINKLKYSE
jgi:RNA polymerase sigma factor (sigma-70 family)